MKNYIVIDVENERNYKITSESFEAVIERFCSEVGIKDESFLEYIYNPSIDGFWFRFIGQDEYDYEGTMEVIEYPKEEVDRRVKEFFQYAPECIDDFNKYLEDENRNYKLTDFILGYIWMNCDGGYGYSGISTDFEGYSAYKLIVVEDCIVI